MYIFYTLVKIEKKYDGILHDRITTKDETEPSNHLYEGSS